MLYNIDKNDIQTNVMCIKCKYFDKKTHKCNGIGKVCFEYDKKTKTIIDPITKLPLKLKGR